MAFAKPLPIETERLSLRLVEPWDLADLTEVHDSDEVTRFLPYGAWRSRADAQEWYRRTVARHDEGSVLQFVMVERAMAKVIGSCLLFHLDEPSARAEVGYVLGRAHWGKGLAHEALSGLLAQAFGPLALRRIEAQIDPRNTASERLLLRLGFQCEGLQRQRWFQKGELRDAQLFGMLRNEWQPFALSPAADPGR
jgi:[ribosomal protein S5]-alanine N-acetyltransferase